MTHFPDRIESAIAILRQGRLPSPRAIGRLPEHCTPADAEEAMEIQDALNERLSSDGLGEIVGTKIGCTTQVMQEYLGMSHPCSGAIFDSTVHKLEGRVAFDLFLHVGVECEIAVRLGETIEATNETHTKESISRSVKSVHAAIEIVDDRYVDFESRVPDWRTWVADNFFGAGVVLGPPVDDWQSLDLASLKGSMSINGTEVGSGHGRDIINGHPLEALAWLANQQSRRGRSLPAGWIVMLGSVVQTKWVGHGDTVEVELQGLGQARVVFE